MGGLAHLVSGGGRREFAFNKINKYRCGHTLKKELKGWSVFCRAEEWAANGVFFFEAIKGEIELNVLDICNNYICIASDDINI